MPYNLLKQIAEYKKSTEEEAPASSSQKSSQKIIELIKENAGITTQQMADKSSKPCKGARN